MLGIYRSISGHEGSACDHTGPCTKAECQTSLNHISVSNPKLQHVIVYDQNPVGDTIGTYTSHKMLSTQRKYVNSEDEERFRATVFKVEADHIASHIWRTPFYLERLVLCKV
jgi:hypothetical protein